jgi:hypothetical protein
VKRALETKGFRRDAVADLCMEMKQKSQRGWISVIFILLGRDSRYGLPPRRLRLWGQHMYFFKRLSTADAVCVQHSAAVALAANSVLVFFR